MDFRETYTSNKYLVTSFQTRFKHYQYHRDNYTHKTRIIHNIFKITFHTRIRNIFANHAYVFLSSTSINVETATKKKKKEKQKRVQLSPFGMLRAEGV